MHQHDKGGLSAQPSYPPHFPSSFTPSPPSSPPVHVLRCQFNASQVQHAASLHHLVPAQSTAPFPPQFSSIPRIPRYQFNVTRVQRAAALNVEDSWMYEDGQDEVVFTVDQACQLLGVGLCGTEGGLTVELDVYEVSVCVGGRGGAGRKERFSPSSWTSKRCVCVCVCVCVRVCVCALGGEGGTEGGGEGHEGESERQGGRPGKLRQRAVRADSCFTAGLPPPP